MGFFDNFAKPPHRSPAKLRKFVDIEGDKEQRRLSNDSTASPTVRNEDLCSIEGDDNHSDLRQKLSFVSLDDMPATRLPSPRRHQSSRDCFSSKKLAFQGDLISPKKPLTLKGIEKAISTNPCRSSKGSVEKETTLQRLSIAASPRRSIVAKNLSNRLLGRGKSSVEETSTAQLPEENLNHQQKGLALLFEKSEVISHNTALVIPSTPTRATARKLVCNKMEGFEDTSLECVDSCSSPPTSPLHTIARTLSWSNMDALVAPSLDGDETLHAARKTVRAPTSPQRSPVKPMVNRLSKSMMAAINASLLDGNDSRVGSTSPISGMIKTLSTRDIEVAPDASHLAEQTRERPQSPMRRIASKLSLRSLCGSSSKTLDCDEGALDNSTRRFTLNKHLSCSKFDRSSGSSDAASTGSDKSTYRPGSRSSMTSMLRKTTSLRGMRSSCMSKTSAVDTSTPEAASRVINASPNGRLGRSHSPRRIRKQQSESRMLSASPKRTMQKQRSDRHVHSTSPKRSMHKTCLTSDIPPTSPRRNSNQAPFKSSAKPDYQNQLPQRSLDKSMQKFSSFEVPQSPVKKTCATARKLGAVPILKTPPSSPRRSSVSGSGSPRQAVHANPTKKIQRVQSCKQLMTPMTERKTFASLEDCIGEYDKIVTLDIMDSNDAGGPAGTAATGW